MDAQRLKQWGTRFAAEVLAEPEARDAYIELCRQANILIEKASGHLTTTKVLSLTAALTTAIMSGLDGSKEK